MKPRCAPCVFSCATIAAVASELGLELRYIEAMNGLIASM